MGVRARARVGARARVRVSVRVRARVRASVSVRVRVSVFLRVSVRLRVRVRVRVRVNDLEDLDQLPRRVVRQIGSRRRAPRPTLVDQDDPIQRRVEEATVTLGAATARPAVNEDDRLARFVTALLVVDRVARAHIETALSKVRLK